MVGLREGYYQDQVVNWLPTEGAARGLMLLGHGLNVHPYKMLTLANFFHELRLDVVLFALAGHRVGAPVSNVSDKKWMDDSGEALKFAENIAQKKNYPYYFCGFSSSCLPIQRHLQQGQWGLKKQILLAPGIAVHRTIKATFPLMPLPFKFKIKSLTPLKYRYNSHLNLQVYNAFRKCYLEFHNNSKDKIDIPTIVYHRTTDELISGKGLMELIKGLGHWNYFPIAPQQTGYWQHLIIDSYSMGDADWAGFKQNVKTFLI